MPRKFYLFYGVLVLLLLGDTIILAQKPDSPVSKPATITKKPPAKSFLGKATGIITMNAEEAKQVIALPLKIVDDKNVAYVISSYQFAYKRIGITEDEETGKTSAQSDIAANRFTTTPLPPVWQKNISDGLHTGEELYFFDIIVFDKQGRRFFAPEIKIAIQ